MHFIYFPSNVMSSVSLIAEYNSIAHMWHIFSSYLSVDIYLEFFCILVIMNAVTDNTNVNLLLLIQSPLDTDPEAVQWDKRPTFRFSNNLHTDFHSD